MNKVQKVYEIWSKFYNPSLVLWNGMARKADHEFMRLLPKYVKKNGDIFDVGVGTGNNIKRMRTLHIPFHSYTGVDLSPDMLNVAIKNYGNLPNIILQNADITKYHLRKEYDTIISTWVFSHLKNPEEIIKKLQNSLKKDGYLILMFLSESKTKGILKSIVSKILKYFSAKNVPYEKMQKFPSSIVEKHINWFGGMISIYVFEANSK